MLCVLHCAVGPKVFQDITKLQTRQWWGFNLTLDTFMPFVRAFVNMLLFFFQFSMTPEYVDDCFNGTLVQANADNKKVAIF